MKNLECIYDGAKSFYSKAKVNYEYGMKVLYSYGTLVCTIENDEVKIYRIL